LMYGLVPGVEGGVESFSACEVLPGRLTAQRWPGPWNQGACTLYTGADC
jgi:hypothetical protein